MKNFTEVKLEIFAPREYALQIRDKLAEIGVGHIGEYDHCVAIHPVQGYYRPLPDSKPFEGEVGQEGLYCCPSVQSLYTNSVFHRLVATLKNTNSPSVSLTP